MAPTIRHRSAVRTSATFVEEVFQKKWPYFLLAGVGLTCHLFFALPTFPWPDRVLAWLPLVLLLVILRALIRKNSKKDCLLLLVSVQIYLFYSVPQFSQDSVGLIGSIYTPSSEAIRSTMLLVVGGELIFIGGYALASRLGAGYVAALYQKLPTPNSAWVRIVVPYSFVGFVVYMFRALRPDYIPLSFSYAASQFFNVYLGLTLMLFFSHTVKNRRLLVLAHALALAMAAVGFIEGMLGVMLAPLLVLFLTEWIWVGNFRLRTVLLAVIIAVIINPVKNEFRLLSWVDKDVSSLQEVGVRLDDWSTSFSRVWIDMGSDESPLLPTASRTSDLLSFAQTIDYVPSAIPFKNGEGLDSALLFWVPRAIWAEKGSSSDLLNNQYAVDFGYATDEQIKQTTVGASIFTEGYWQFGVSGVLSFLFLSGSLFGLFFNPRIRSRTSDIVYVVFIAPQIFVLQALTITLASLFSFLLGITVALVGIHLAAQILARAVRPT
jgi:hypothetical protein